MTCLERLLKLKLAWQNAVFHLRPPILWQKNVPRHFAEHPERAPPGAEGAVHTVAAAVVVVAVVLGKDDSLHELGLVYGAGPGHERESVSLESEFFLT